MIKQITLGLVMAGTVIGCAQENLMDLEGSLKMKGSAPHAYLVIEDQKSHTNYKIKNAKTFDLIRKQKHVVKIKAKLIGKAKGPGWPAVVEVLEVR